MRTWGVGGTRTYGQGARAHEASGGGGSGGWAGRDGAKDDGRGFRRPGLTRHVHTGGNGSSSSSSSPPSPDGWPAGTHRRMHGHYHVVPEPGTHAHTGAQPAQGKEVQRVQGVEQVPADKGGGGGGSHSTPPTGARDGHGTARQHKLHAARSEEAATKTQSSSAHGRHHGSAGGRAGQYAGGWVGVRM
jgi:hypothetical protein